MPPERNIHFAIVESDAAKTFHVILIQFNSRHHLFQGSSLAQAVTAGVYQTWAEKARRSQPQALINPKQTHRLTR